MISRSMIRGICLIAWLTLTAPTDAAAVHEIVLHVSTQAEASRADDAGAAFESPAAAIAALARIAADSNQADVRILLHDDVYRIEQPLTIRRRDVPLQGSLTIEAAEGRTVTISGGRPISDWAIEENGAWTSQLKNDDGVSIQLPFRELFVNGERRPRARHPNAGYLRVVESMADKRSGFTFRSEDLPNNWTGGGELVFLHDWSTSRIPVRRVDHDERRLLAAFPIGNRAMHYQIDHFEPHPRYYAEDHVAFLDSPGEWLLASDGALTYLPLPGESPDATEVIVPVANQLLRVLGDQQEPIRNVHIQGLAFEHCRWPLPKQGFAASQATAHERRGPSNTDGPRAFVPPAVEFELAEDCSFTLGRLAHLGTSGIEFGSRTRRCRLEDSVIDDVSGNGANIGEDASRTVDGGRWWQVAPQEASAGNVIRRNRITRCGQQFFGSVAVWVGLARDVTIANNEIAHHPYTGVSVGWMWNPTPTPARGNVVAQNHIHHVMQVLSDGGGIYTLGRQPKTRLVENVIHDVPLNMGRAESNGMFLDEGTDQTEIAGNVIYGVDRSPLRFHRAEQVTVRDNTLVVPNADTPPVRFNNTDPATIEQIDNRVETVQEFDAAEIELPATGPR